MNLKKRPALLFVFTALIVTVCRCGGAMGPTMQPIMVADGSMIGSCEFKQEVSETSEGGSDPVFIPVWECSVTCPNNSQVKFDTYTQLPAVIAAGEKEAFLAQYCSAEAMIAAPAASETPTEEPASTVVTPTASTSTATSVPTEQVIIIPQQNIFILQPVLAGGVSACDTRLGFINFPISDPIPDLTGKNVTVSLNGRQVNCTVAGSRNQVLACSLPTGTTFPVTVKASLDDVEVNNFSFNGAICTKTLPTQENEPNDSTTQVPTTVPIDCTLDPYNPAC